MMIRFEIDTKIRCPQEVVFDHLTDINHYVQWLPQTGIFISTRQLSEGTPKLGTRYRDNTTMGTFQGEIIEFQRPTRVVFRHRLHWLGLPVMETRPGYTLESADGVTRVHHTAEGELFGLFKLLQPRAARIAQRERQRTVDALKMSLETSPPS